MKKKLCLSALCALAVFLCSCAATSVQKTWKSSDAQKPQGKVAVFALAERGIVRQGFENRFVNELGKTGVQSVTTFEQFSANQARLDKAAAAKRLRDAGAQAVLVIKPVDATMSYREIQPGGESYRGAITGVENYGWYDYYSVGFLSWSPTYGSLKQTLFLESILFDLNTEKRLWSGVTRTVFNENDDKVAEMDPIVSKIVAAMRKDGVIQ